MEGGVGPKHANIVLGSSHNSLNSAVGGAYAPPSVFFGRCICTAQTNFIKTLILFLKIEILELKFRKNTVFFVIKKYNF